MGKPADQKCVVFTHFVSGGHSVSDPNRLRTLRDEWRRRLERYAKCQETIERVFVFISEGYFALASIRRREAPFVGLQADRTLVRILREESDNAGCPRGFIIPIGVDALVNLLSRLQLQLNGLGKDISQLLLGSGKYMRYDSPKMVDAILRIAGRNTGRPLFRIDDDVEPRNASFKKLLIAFRKLPNRSLDAIYAFSGGYGGWDYSNPRQQQKALLNNYAVRTSHLAQRTSAGWQLHPTQCGAFLKGLSLIGAHQGFSRTKGAGDKADAQVISGAGLCLSYAAVKKLPPFANLDNAVTWIDDHLKRKMHEALDDLGANRSTARVKGALFKQDRHPSGLCDSDMMGVGAQNYLCTLARGCIFDALVHSGGNLGPYTEFIRGWLDGSFCFPTIFAQPRNQDGGRETPRPLTDFGMELAKAGEKRVRAIARSWLSQLSAERLSFKDDKIKKRFIPKLHMPRSCLCSPVFDRRAKTVMTNADRCLVYQVLEDAEQYLDLLGIWRAFVNLLEEMTPLGTDWLFDRFDDKHGQSH